MKFIVLSKKQAAEFVYAGPWAAISVSTDENNWPVISTENRLGLLQLWFDDRSSPLYVNHPLISGRYFQPAQAEQILDFFLGLKDQAELFLVHCEAGMSRSPAIAAALTHVLAGNGSDDFFFKRYTPNSFVYKMILETFYQNQKYGQLAEEMKKVNLDKKAEEQIHDEPWDCKS